MGQDPALSVFMKRRFASFARRPGSAASGACRWKILLTICTKQNHEVVCRSVSFLLGSARQARRKVFTNRQRLCADSRFLLARKQQTLGDQKTMKKAKSVIAFVFLVVLCVSVASVEYDPVMGLGTCLTFPSAFSVYSSYW